MNTFKTAVVLATLIGVGYGVHVVLNKPIPHGQRADAGAWDEIPEINYDSMDAPDVSVPNELVPPPLNSDPSAMIPSSTPAVPTGATPAPETGPRDYAQAGAVVPVPNEPNLPTSATTAAPDWNTDPLDLPEGAEAPAALSTAPPPGGGLPTATATATPPSAAPGAEATAPPATAAPAAPSTDIPSSASTATALPGDTPAAASASSSSGGFEAVWQSAQTKLAEGKYADALLTLSMVYHDKTLSIQDRDRLIPLLDQLAGTVIYSREHHLVSQFTANGGETLQQVGAQYQVPAEFLARVNGIPTATALSQGQELKVVPGPFRAELDLGRRQLTLFLGQYYAGRFSVGVGSDLPPNVTQMEVIEKSGPRAYRDVQTNHEIAAGAPNNPYGDHWIGLRDPQQPTNNLLGIHSWGAEVDAADTRGCISVDAQGADDLKAILSIGSLVTVLR